MDLNITLGSIAISLANVFNSQSEESDARSPVALFAQCVLACGVIALSIPYFSRCSRKLNGRLAVVGAPNKELPNPVKLARHALKPHRHSGSLTKQDNLNFIECDAEHTKLFHSILLNFFSGENLKKHLPLMKCKSNELIRMRAVSDNNDLSSSGLNAVIHEYCFQVFCDILLGYRGSFCTSVPANFISESENDGLDHERLQSTWELICRSDHDDPSKLIGYLREKGVSLSVNQKAQFVFIPLNTTLTMVSSVLKQAIREFSRRPELQELVNQTVNDEEAFKEVLRKVLVETMRMSPPSPFVSRTWTYISISQFARDAGIVGPNPETFDVNRLKKVPTSLPALPWMPFGAGLHSCPGWRLFEHLSLEMLTAILTRYRLDYVEEESVTRFIPRP